MSSPASVCLGVGTASCGNSDEPFYYSMDTDFRKLNDHAVSRLAKQLSVGAPGTDRDWRMTADLLGYSAHDIDVFTLQDNVQLPAYKMLRNWSCREGSKIRILYETLQQIERQDVILLLDELRKRRMTLYICFKMEDKRKQNSEVVTEGRKTLLSALLPKLETFAASELDDRIQQLLFRLEKVSTGSNWLTEMHKFQGQQVDIKVSFTRRPTLNEQQHIQLSERCWLINNQLVTVLSDNSSLLEMDAEISLHSTTLDSVTTASPAAVPSDLLSDLPAMPYDSTYPHSPPPGSPGDDVDKLDDEAVAREELRQTAGFHGSVGNRSSLIKKELRCSRSDDGSYILRCYTDDKTQRFNIALSLVWQGKIRHFYIFRRRVIDCSSSNSNNATQLVYYLTKDGFSAPCLQSLLDHYKLHCIASSNGDLVTLSQPV